MWISFFFIYNLLNVIHISLLKTMRNKAAKAMELFKRLNFSDIVLSVNTVPSYLIFS